MAILKPIALVAALFVFAVATPAAFACSGKCEQGSGKQSDCTDSNCD
jgi:hypothetical protein